MAYRACIICSLILALSLFSCSKDGQQGKGTYTKIVSLSPSITRQIVDLGSEEFLAGVTSYHPPLKKKVPVIGTITRPNIELIMLTAPDVVFCSEEDQGVQNISRITAAGINVVVFPRALTFADLARNYEKLGRCIGRESVAAAKLKQYREEYDSLVNNNAEKRIHEKVTVAFIVSQRPLIVVSGKSFIGNIIRDAGGRNMYESAGLPYPIISPESLVHEDPDMVLSIIPGTAVFLKNIFKGIRCSSLASGSVYDIKPDHVAYYTVSDYLVSVTEVSALIKQTGQKIDSPERGPRR
ncbi:MAG TPA: helical backbone metal receptor [Spirochaetota bacterium]|nr:helical backbone metal receptor [Spirochaetota bacterium]HPI89202.1 helical backbone metal receptor [Spirochaetota bacterium]HPR48981.1 helical backbone metal receptor [Spirochaetota bacterium]